MGGRLWRGGVPGGVGVKEDNMVESREEEGEREVLDRKYREKLNNWVRR